MAADDDFQDKALEGFTMFALNQGEVCTCPSRSLIQADIYDEFLELAAIRTKAVRQGDPLDTETMLGLPGLQRPAGKDPVLHRDRQGARAPRSSPAVSAPSLAATCPAATTCSRRSSPAHNAMRIFQEEIFGPVVAVTSFDDYDDAIAIANDTLYGLGAGRVEPRRQHRLPGRARHQGRPGVGQLLSRLSARTPRSAATSSPASAGKATR